MNGLKYSPRRCVYAGSFDPVTLGHVDVIVRGATLFDHVTVGIGVNPDKQPLFTADQRRALLREVLVDVPNVSVEFFSGLTVDFVREQGASVMLRAIRTVSDMDSEFNLALANQTLAPDLETVFLMASDRFSHVSSSMIKQVAQLAGPNCAEQLRHFVPEAVIRPLIERSQGTLR
ncbi:MAG: pantetheine-phosphate adenylyltransferase [Planctomycetaceae bacterium]